MRGWSWKSNPKIVEACQQLKTRNRRYLDADKKLILGIIDCAMNESKKYATEEEMEKVSFKKSLLVAIELSLPEINSKRGFGDVSTSDIVRWMQVRNRERLKRAQCILTVHETDTGGLSDTV
jgi:hypothetical protein